MKKKIRKPRPFTIQGCEIFSIGESNMGGEFVRIMGMLLPKSDIKKLRLKLDEAIAYLEQK